MDKAKRYHIYKNMKKDEMFQKLIEFSDVLDKILTAHEMSCVDWPAMREAERVMEDIR